jgi:hypothetical protein
VFGRIGSRQVSVFTYVFPLWEQIFLGKFYSRILDKISSVISDND